MEMKTACMLWVVLAVVSVHVPFAASKIRDKGVYCSVCRALVHEFNTRIDAADPKKKVQVGSYRVDPKGKQKISEVKYATSDVHLTEILEDVCQAFNDYAMITNQITKREGVVRTKDRAGKELDTSNVRFSAKLRETFKAYCEEVIEIAEDRIMTIFKQEDRSTIEAQLCGEFTEACTEEELLEPVPRLAEKKPKRKLSPYLQSLLEPEDGSPRREPEDDMKTLQEMRDKMEKEKAQKEREERLRARREREANASKTIPPHGHNLQDEL